MVDEQRGGRVRESEREKEALQPLERTLDPGFTPDYAFMPDSTSISSGFNLNVIAVPVIASS